MYSAAQVVDNLQDLLLIEIKGMRENEIESKYRVAYETKLNFPVGSYRTLTNLLNDSGRFYFEKGRWYAKPVERTAGIQADIMRTTAAKMKNIPAHERAKLNARGAALANHAATIMEQRGPSQESSVLNNSAGRACDEGGVRKEDGPDRGNYDGGRRFGDDGPSSSSHSQFGAGVSQRRGFGGGDNDRRRFEFDEPLPSYRDNDDGGVIRRRTNNHDRSRFDEDELSSRYNSREDDGRNGQRASQQPPQRQQSEGGRREVDDVSPAPLPPKKTTLKPPRFVMGGSRRSNQPEPDNRAVVRQPEPPLPPHVPPENRQRYRQDDDYRRQDVQPDGVYRSHASPPRFRQQYQDYDEFYDRQRPNFDDDDSHRHQRRRSPSPPPTEFRQQQRFDDVDYVDYGRQQDDRDEFPPIGNSYVREDENDGDAAYERLERELDAFYRSPAIGRRRRYSASDIERGTLVAVRPHGHWLRGYVWDEDWTEDDRRILLVYLVDWAECRGVDVRDAIAEGLLQELDERFSRGIVVPPPPPRSP